VRTAATIAALLALAPSRGGLDPDFPAYSVPADAVIERAYTSRTELESEPAVVFVDGEEAPTGKQGELRLRVVDERTMKVVDTVKSTADGRPTEFTRAFGELDSQGVEKLVAIPKDGDETEKKTERERSSPLAGRTVRFTWDPKDEEYARKLEGETPKSDETADGDGPDDEELLEGLQPDLDWLVLLEDGPREKGASWSIDAKLFTRVQYPLGELHWVVAGQPRDPVSTAVTEQLNASLSGEARATWDGVREVDGRSLGVFTIHAELASKAEAETPDGAEVRKVEAELEYDGEVLWDMAAGRIHSYALEGDVHTVLTSQRTVASPKGDHEIRQVFDLTGKAVHTLQVAAGD
jgi:hypothetical protein